MCSKSYTNKKNRLRLKNVDCNMKQEEANKRKKEVSVHLVPISEADLE